MVPIADEFVSAGCSGSATSAAIETPVIVQVLSKTSAFSKIFEDTYESESSIALLQPSPRKILRKPDDLGQCCDEFSAFTRAMWAQKLPDDLTLARHLERTAVV